MSELDGDSLSEVADFITQNEQDNITLSSLFYKDGSCSMPAASKYKVLLFRDASFSMRGSSCAAPLKGVISFSDTGHILHCLKFTTAQEETAFRKLIAAEIPSDRVFCILGEKNGCELIAGVIKKRRHASIDYTLMHYAGGANALMLPASLSLLRCGADDADMLFPLQKNYELVEVLLDAAELDEAFCRLNLKRLLREQIIYALFAEQENIAVAKAGTNARGKNWYQLGGIYTRTDHRNKGCAAFLAQFLAEKFKAEGKNTALFVKDNNIAAQKAYERAGYVKDKPFEIIYY